MYVCVCAEARINVRPSSITLSSYFLRKGLLGLWSTSVSPELGRQREVCPWGCQDSQHILISEF